MQDGGAAGHASPGARAPGDSGRGARGTDGGRLVSTTGLVLSYIRHVFVAEVAWASASCTTSHSPRNSLLLCCRRSGVLYTKHKNLLSISQEKSSYTIPSPTASPLLSASLGELCVSRPASRNAPSKSSASNLTPFVALLPCALSLCHSLSLLLRTTYACRSTKLGSALFSGSESASPVAPDPGARRGALGLLADMWSARPRPGAMVRARESVGEGGGGWRVRKGCAGGGEGDEGEGEGREGTKCRKRRVVAIDLRDRQYLSLNCWNRLT